MDHLRDINSNPPGMEGITLTWIAPDKLRPLGRRARTHSRKQIGQIAERSAAALLQQPSQLHVGQPLQTAQFLGGGPVDRHGRRGRHRAARGLAAAAARSGWGRGSFARAALA